MRSRQRRRILEAAVGGAGAVLLSGGPGGFAAFAQHDATAPQPAALRDGLLQLGGLGGNIVLLGGASGVAMVDSGSPEHEQSVARFVAQHFGGAPVEILFNTHWHLGHTGGNETIGRAGARIIGHESTRLWMSTKFFVDWMDRTFEPRPAKARPTETFYSSEPQPISLDFGGTRIEYGLLREAHTDGDIYVRFPDQNVIAAGGAVTAGRYPVLDYITGGSMDGLLAATQTLIDMSDTETLIVPARGPAQTRAALEAQRDMIAAVLERMRSLARQGKSVAEMLAAGITAEFDARWGKNTELFVTNAYKSLWGLGP